MTIHFNKNKHSVISNSVTNEQKKIIQQDQITD